MECVICYDKIGETNKCITPCGHTFCCNCIMKSTQYNSACPYCRTDLYETHEEEENSDVEEDAEEDENEYGCSPENGSFDREGYHKLPIAIEDPLNLHWIIEYFPPDTYTQDYMDENSTAIASYNSFMEIQKTNPTIRIEDVFDNIDLPSDDHKNFYIKKQEKRQRAIELFQSTRSIMAVIKKKRNEYETTEHPQTNSGLVLRIPRQTKTYTLAIYL